MGSLRALGLALIMTPAIAGAQAKPTDSLKQQAGDLVKKAIAKSQAGDHALAIELYEQAFTLVPTPLLLSNIGAEYQAMGNKPVEALKYFCKYLDADPTGSNVTYATAQIKTLQIQQGIQPDDHDVCKPAPPPPPPIHTSPVEPPATTTAHPAVTTATPGRTLEIVGGTVAGIGAVGIGIGIVYALKGKSLSDFQRDHTTGDPWPATYDGVAIANWNSTGSAWNRDAYIFTISGGVIAIAGAAMFYLGIKSAADEHVSLVATGRGLALMGRF